MERPEIGLDELVEHWTVLDGEKDLVAGGSLAWPWWRVMRWPRT